LFKSQWLLFTSEYKATMEYPSTYKVNILFYRRRS
jgi:hypothetical protein